MEPPMIQPIEPDPRDESDVLPVEDDNIVPEESEDITPSQSDALAAELKAVITDLARHAPTTQLHTLLMRYVSAVSPRLASDEGNLPCTLRRHPVNPDRAAAPATWGSVLCFCIGRAVAVYYATRRGKVVRGGASAVNKLRELRAAGNYAAVYKVDGSEQRGYTLRHRDDIRKERRRIEERKEKKKEQDE